MKKRRCAECGDDAGTRFVRPLQPGQSLEDIFLRRDPLCQTCWETITGMEAAPLSSFRERRRDKR